MKENIKTALESIGLSDKESRVYLAALELGEGTVTNITHRTKLKRTTSHNIIQSMADKGLLSVVTRKGIQYVSALSPAMLLEKTKNAHNSFVDIYKDLVFLAKSAYLQPQIQFFPNLEGIKHCYLQIEDATGDVVGFTNYDTMPREVFDYIQKIFIPLRKKRHIPARFIIPYSEKSKQVAEFDKENAISHKLIPQMDRSTQIEMLLMNHTDCYFLSYGKHDTYGIKIQSKTIYDMLKNIFELQWRSEY